MDEQTKVLGAARYESLPREIVAVEFQPDTMPLPPNVYEQAGTWYVWNMLHQSKINLEPGDMVNITDLSDTYPIARAKFDQTYRKVSI